MGLSIRQVICVLVWNFYTWNILCLKYFIYAWSMFAMHSSSNWFMHFSWFLGSFYLVYSIKVNSGQHDEYHGLAITVQCVLIYCLKYYSSLSFRLQNLTASILLNRNFYWCFSHVIVEALMVGSLLLSTICKLSNTCRKWITS